jgi:hypothetical protein
VALFTIDVVLTLAGQTAKYWSGNYQVVVEGNPLALSILACGPWVFVAAAAGWGVAVSTDSGGSRTRGSRGGSSIIIPGGSYRKPWPALASIAGNPTWHAIFSHGDLRAIEIVGVLAKISAFRLVQKRFRMRSDVTASSRHQHLVLYDPAAIPLDTPLDADLDTQVPIPLPAAAMAHLAEQGQALVLRIAHDDCQADLRLIIEEVVEPYLRERAVQALGRAALRIPGGKLTIDGVEFLSRAGERRLHSEAACIAIPAGDYDVEVLNLMPWKSRHRALEVAKQTTRIDRIVGGIVAAFTWLGVLLIPANILVAAPAVVIVWLISGWRPALTLAGLVLLLDVLILAGFWGLEIGSRWVPALRRRSDATLAFDAENPDVVVCLQRQVGEGMSKVRAMATLDLE